MFDYSVSFYRSMLLTRLSSGLIAVTFMIVMIHVHITITEISREFKSVYHVYGYTVLNGDLFITFIARTNFLVGRMAGE